MKKSRHHLFPSSTNKNTPITTLTLPNTTQPTKPDENPANDILKLAKPISFIEQDDDQLLLKLAIKTQTPPPNTDEQIQPDNLNKKKKIFQSIPKTPYTPYSPHSPSHQTHPTLDLHGCTQIEALSKLQSFLYDSSHKKYQKILVITGKGLHSGCQGPILFQTVSQWLQTTTAKTLIKRFSSAPPNMGGSGAILIYLKNCKE